MAGPYNPPKKGAASIFYVALQDMANPGSFLANPAILAAKFQVSGDTGALANTTNLPIVSPAGSIWVEISLTAAEMNFDVIKVQCIDTASPKLFADLAFSVPTSDATGNVIVGGYAAGQDPATLWLAGTIGGVTLQNYMRDIAAGVCGVSSGSGSGLESYSDRAGSLAFVVHIDGSGNRTQVDQH